MPAKTDLLDLLIKKPEGVRGAAGKVTYTALALQQTPKDKEEAMKNCILHRMRLKVEDPRWQTLQLILNPKKKEPMEHKEKKDARIFSRQSHQQSSSRPSPSARQRTNSLRPRK